MAEANKEIFLHQKLGTKTQSVLESNELLKAIFARQLEDKDVPGAKKFINQFCRGEEIEIYTNKLNMVELSNA